MKPISLILAVIMLFAFIAPVSASVSAQDRAVSDGFFCGDMDGDRKTLLKDASYLAKHLAGWTDFAVGDSIADVSGDGKVDSRDLSLLMKYLTGWDVKLYGGVGYDGLSFRTIQAAEDGEGGTDDMIPVSLYKNYTTSIAANGTYPDVGKELTDGIKAGDPCTYKTGEFSGYLGENVDIDVDLGDDGKKLYYFELSYLCTNEAGINPPRSVAVYTSDDCENWTKTGDCALGEFENRTRKSAVLMTEAPVDARYVRFSAEKVSSWLFFDEVTVLSKEKIIASNRVVSAFMNNGLEDDRLQIGELESGLRYDAALGSTLVSLGKTCTVSGSSYDPRATNKAGSLTDGCDIGAAGSDNVWTGIKANKEATVNLNLGTRFDRLYSFSVSCLSNRAEKIVLPVYVDFYAGNETTDMKFIGRVYAPIIPSATSFNYVVSFEDLLSAKYVRAVLPAEEDGFYWIEEMKAFNNDSEEVSAGHYGSPRIKPTEAEYWSKSEADYTLSQDLACGKKLYFYAGDLVNAGSNPKNAGLLNDGVVTQSLNRYDGKWFHTYGAESRTAVVDLGRTSAVKEMQISFLSKEADDIHVPDTVRFFLSEDGENWYLVKEMENNASSGDSICEDKIELDRAYTARYAAVYYTVKTHSYADNFAVTGTKSVSGASSVTDSGFEKTDIFDHIVVEGYTTPDPALLGGAKDIVLVYFRQNDVKITEDSLLPYVAYLDRDGKIKDTMFDGFLFLPRVRALPVSGELPDGGKTVMGDWEALSYQMFSEADGGVNALESVAAKVGDALGDPGYKVSFYVAFPNLHPEVTDFGDVDGDGVSEDLSETADCQKVIQWYIDKVGSEIKSKGYKHVELCGYYWFSESCDGAYKSIVKAASETVHKNGEQFFWIPYFRAIGFSDWKELGFDAACLQPNYAFHMDVPENRLFENAQLTSANGMCYEMETNNSIVNSTAYYKKYINYMKYGVMYGYCDAINMYYQGIDVFNMLCRSDNSRLRLMYDYQYRYIKNTLSFAAEPAVDAKFTVDSGSLFTGRLGDVDPATCYALTKSPEHGSITFFEDGKFTYIPNEGYCGTDTFKFAVNHYFDNGESASVYISVR